MKTAKTKKVEVVVNQKRRGRPPGKKAKTTPTPTQTTQPTPAPTPPAQTRPTIQLPLVLDVPIDLVLAALQEKLHEK